MSNLFEHSKVTAYFLWEYTGHDSALALWYCAEDMALFFEHMGYYWENPVNEILQKGRGSIEYIEFIRHIAFYIFSYTQNSDDIKNWFAAERLISNGEVLSALCSIASLYNTNKEQFSKLGVRSEQVRRHYQ
ncbi:hypothetical protein AGMMS49975_10530 [Clostridia bacterium]|nr:hypothetical protein AGMMS49975_10530 [Clostridia bacterium]